MVVREGGVTRASERLHVSQPTLCTQIRDLEDALGDKLLTRSGRSVALNRVGDRVEVEGWRALVLSATRRRVTLVRFERVGESAR
jgi:DNA-binding transcriptional LysR family regulator